MGTRSVNYVLTVFALTVCVLTVWVLTVWVLTVYALTVNLKHVERIVQLILIFFESFKYQ